MLVNVAKSEPIGQRVGVKSKLVGGTVESRAKSDGRRGEWS